MKSRKLMQAYRDLAASQDEDLEGALTRWSVSPELEARPIVTQPSGMTLRAIHQAIALKRDEITRLSANAEALDLTAEAMPPADREHAQRTAKLAREQIRKAICALHELEAKLPSTAEAVDWVGQFAFETEPVKLPAEMAHLWAGNLDHAIAA